jgi:chromosome segregation protein
MESLQLDQRIDSISERIAAEYDVSLHEAAIAAPEELDLDRASATSEVDQLQSQLKSGGSVNLDALQELQELEQRHSTLSSQLEDMQSARMQLQQISQRMNARCAAIYIETVNNIRIHFQEVFRALFGGGDADILVEPMDDSSPLEAGVSIVARPPGKQPRSISLLSGGEKTLTCVALLLAIFRNRPSPFCVLDEVDAALDETNIDRFLTALRQFMGSTQFIVVTHSKRTMTCADTLYGVTMQESGVSKRVSVRFEDVGENGEIRVATANESPPLAAGTERRAA